MIVFKSCPRCRGDLHVGMDDEVSCLQCGYELKAEERTRLHSKLEDVRSRRLPLAA